MELLVAEALKRVGEEFSFSITEPQQPQTFGGREIRFSAPLSVNGFYVFDGKAFTVSGKVDTVLRSKCARCAELFDEPFSFGFSERFVRSIALSPDDEETYPYDGDRISIDKAVGDNLFLQLPLTSVCKKDCKGLCPVCGKNRNTEPCNCEQIGSLGAFSALRGLKFEDE